ncbi:MAG: hypothetical protein A2W90_02325 [Bacteroidetes bacterium GWF2_42_66]|nr:MAG: hypothetical protein A2W89_15810 [Bacteroidetes bacterium GWE2_42_39]OFY42030.1 MAG: hypothetical protein A2W90_02325 [Bacteroidetes bacterium GWF2_42_66]HBL77769.1 hypothetical protein [Prolixibacteraceae bacterium]HCB62898.1 hypothetical protein [Bacteroidales bacterium]
MHETFYPFLKKLIQVTVAGILFLVFPACPSWSQSNNIASHASLAEKIYLQTDGKVYTTDKTIWFKAIVTNAIDHAPAILSGVLYVELIGPDERIVERKLIKLAKGIGNGFLELDQRYPEGVYQIRAYTEWNKNFGTDFFFTEYLRVFAPSANQKPDPMPNVTLVKEQNNERRLNAYFNPLAIDSLHKKELTLILTFDDTKDTLSVKRNDDNSYRLNYILPAESQFVTLQMQTKNLFTYSKTIALNEDHTDLQFFPESGELVHGLQSRVGFKALDYSGKGKFVEGEIVNGEGEVITVFQSNELGMGSFILGKTDSTVTYFARLQSPTEEGLSLMYPLPKVASVGNVLSVNKRGDQIRMTVASNYLKNDSILLRISCRGMVYYDIKGPLKGGVLALVMAANKFPEGIIAFTLMDTLMQPVAERLYFNERPESRINIALSTDRESYTQRESTTLNIETTNNLGEAVNANVSLLVLNKEQLGQIQSTRQNILSYFLISSELKGTIENPGFYFSKKNERYNDLDALLLTQGWRKYHYTKPVGKIIFQPQPTLTVSGSVSGAIFQKKKKEVELTMMTFGNNRSFHKQRTDNLGRFSFNINDEYGQNLNILIQSANKSGEKRDYTITLDKKESPAVSFDPIRSVERADSVMHALVEKNIERKMVEDAFPLSAGDILLGEVVVEGYKMTPERKKVMEEYGKPDDVIEGEAIQAKEEKWSYGLYSVLLFNFPDKVIIERDSVGVMHAKVNHSEMTLVVIDGIPVKDYEYPFIANIPPGEVSSFEIIESAKNFSKLYMEAYPYADPMSAPAWGDVIAIYTHGRKGIYGASQPVGIVQAAVPVFSAPREFYAPKYENSQTIDWFKPDYRALVHWQPEIVTDSLGRATAVFYNADVPGEMQVVVEAISENGEIGYQEIFYEVKKRM